VNGADKKQRVNPLKLEKLRSRCAAVESEIASAEAEIASLEAGLAEYRSADETIRLTTALEARRKSLETLMSEWESVSAEIEASA
jgi:prefoldin subunit 5